MFNPNIEKFKEGIKTSLHNNGIVALENALVPEIAENLYRELTESDAWSHEVIEENIGTPRYFRYSREHIKFDSGKEPPNLLALRDFLRSNECRNLVAELSGMASMKFEGAAARMGPGDSIDVHNDANSSDRTLAFVLYLNKHWQASDGGEFVFQDPYMEIMPGFNKVAMFMVNHSSHHLVKRISDDAKEKRLCIAGWFHWR